jgi:TonB-dependent starch-binding outer membrane protein SusC
MMKNSKTVGFYSRRGILLLVVLNICSNLFSNAINAVEFARSSTDTLLFAKYPVNIGYGFQDRNEITGSIYLIGSEKFNQGNISDLMQLIQGKVAGLSITRPGSDPNMSFEIRLRGLSTAFTNSAPLIVIDGMIGGDPGSVDPNDIESFTILKDGSAAIYGLGSSGGVILITTKKGHRGKASIEYNGYASAEMVAKNLPAMNTAEWKALSQETGLGTDFGSNTDWFHETEQVALTHAHNIAVSGGTDNTSYRASVNYRNAEGVMLKTGFTQLSGRINLSQKSLNDKLILDLNLSANERKSKYGFNDVFKYASIYNPTAPVKDNNQQFTRYDGYFQQVQFDYYNPVAILNQTLNEGKSDIIDLSLRGTFKITGGLSINAFYSREKEHQLNGQNFGIHDYWIGMNRNGLATRQEDESLKELIESTLQFSGNLSQTVNISLLAGFSSQKITNEGNFNSGGDFLAGDADYNNLGGAMDFTNGRGITSSNKFLNRQASFFGRYTMGINNLVFLTAGARYQGSSLFRSKNKWAVYPSAGVGLDLTRMMQMNPDKNLRLRVNYGVTGNQPDIDNFSYDVSISNLRAEKCGVLNAGIDFSVSNSKLSGSIDYYLKKTKDLVFPTSGPTPLMNFGELKSSGIEFSLNWNVIQNENFSYKLDLNTSCTLDNSFPSLSANINGTHVSIGTWELGDMGSPGQNQVPLAVISEGKPAGQIIGLGFNGIDASGNLRLVDRNGDGRIDSDDRSVIGNGLPKALIGISNAAEYRNWDLNLMFRCVFGHDIVNTYRALYEVPALISFYNLPETAAGLRSPSGVLMRNTSGTFTNRDVENGSFISLANISLGYTFSLPANSHFSKIRLYLAGSNLFYISGYKGSDPEPRYTDSSSQPSSLLVTGIDRVATWPRTRSVTLGINMVL